MNESFSGLQPDCLTFHGLTEDSLTTKVGYMKIGLLASCGLSSILQVYVIVTAVRYIFGDESDRSMHLFLLNMTIADLVLTGYCYPKQSILFFTEADLFAVDFKYPLHIFLWLALLASALSLVMLNLDKLLFFKFPLKYSEIMTQNRAVLLLLATWILSALFMVLLLYSGLLECAQRKSTIRLDEFTNISDHSALAQALAINTKAAKAGDILKTEALPGNFYGITLQDCSNLVIRKGADHRAAIYMTFVTGACIVPVLSSLAVAIYVIHIVRARRRLIAERAQYSRNATNSNGRRELALPVTGSEKRRTIQLLTRIRTFYFIFVSTILSAITLVPYRVYVIFYAQQYAEKAPPFCNILLVGQIAIHLQNFNAILNPVITVTVLPQYRFGQLKLSHIFWKCEDPGEINTISNRRHEGQ